MGLLSQQVCKRNQLCGGFPLACAPPRLTQAVTAAALAAAACLSGFAETMEVLAALLR